MPQKFLSQDEAAQQLGVTKDRLNDLREGGTVRAYRDGAGWKFRIEDIERLVTEGIPAEESSSELSLDTETNEPAAAPVESMSDLSLDLDEDTALASAATSDISLDDLDEPTVPVDAPADGDDVHMAAVEDPDDMSDSILLSEAELGESTDRPPSTIIGKAEMGADVDLELASGQSSSKPESDVQLAPTQSNVFSPASRGDDVLDAEPPGLADNFGGLEELEIDLEAESSRILSPEDVSKAQAAAKKAAPKSAPKAPEFSDLELAASDSQPAAPASGPISDIITAGGSSGGFSGLSALELESSDPEDDEVLGEGSDITLSSESSGINIISPSDSGLALDEVSLELSGASAMGSSLDLGSSVGADPELQPLEVAEDEEGKGSEPFTLTPFGEEAQDEEEDSSQVIPLDEVSEEDAGAFLGAGAEEAGAMGDDFASVGLSAGAAPTGELAYETPFSTWHIVGLSACMLLLAMCGMMVFDLMRNIWSWDGTYTASSTLLQVLNPFLK